MTSNTLQLFQTLPKASQDAIISSMRKEEEEADKKFSIKLQEKLRKDGLDSFGQFVHFPGDVYTGPNWESPQEKQENLDEAYARVLNEELNKGSCSLEMSFQADHLVALKLSMTH